MSIILVSSIMIECKREDLCEYVPFNCGLEAFHIMNSLSNFPTEEFLNEHCSLLLEELRCHKKFIDGCVDIIGPINYFTYYEGMLKVFTDACEKNSAVRREYSKHVACYRNTTMKLNGCTIDIQSKIDLFDDWERNTSDSQNIERRKYGCIGGPLRRRCYTMVILEECGEEAAEVFAGIVRTISSRITELLCPAEMVDVWNAEFTVFHEEHAIDIQEK